ncbi:hypothetical protein K402DRAFT_391592 [Aulographum hederae CBS 113979]|uniref:Uncharacterized protein n=1 Tax=Aulographum hederae CBS 113979 TaxID=1176131 RepID=A0A6G1H6N5_9PEZI|nr:hypothetical protein K402DRAFT_391592 [Aulographum hederae CBS 113979]
MPAVFIILVTQLAPSPTTLLFPFGDFGRRPVRSQLFTLQSPRVTIHRRPQKPSLLGWKCGRLEVEVGVEVDMNM